MLNTVTMKTVEVTNLDPLRNVLVHVQKTDARIAAQEWKKNTLYLRVYLIMWDLNISTGS